LREGTGRGQADTGDRCDDHAHRQISVSLRLIFMINASPSRTFRFGGLWRHGVRLVMPVTGLDPGIVAGITF
jgi:hypothetical protein